MMLKKVIAGILLFMQAKVSYAIFPSFLEGRMCDQHLAGLDFSQFNYLVSVNRRGLNVGVFYQYQLYHFFSINASGFVNNIYEQRQQGYSELADYESHGHCIKGGFEFSLRLNRSKTCRLFLGYQEARIRHSESGRFHVDKLYWGTYDHEYSIPKRTNWATEYIMGLYFGKGKLVFRPQVYVIFDKSYHRVYYQDRFVEGYRSPFVPGFGFRGGGFNLLLLYKIN